VAVISDSEATQTERALRSVQCDASGQAAERTAAVEGCRHTHINPNSITPIFTETSPFRPVI